MALQHRYIPLLFSTIFLISTSFAAASESSIEVKTTLLKIEDLAETMVDTTTAKDLVNSKMLFKSIQQNMDQLHQSMVTAPFNERKSRELLMSYSWLRVISVDITQHAWVGAAIAANQLSASMIRFINYSTLQQRDTAWMDYLTRELILLNMESSDENIQLLKVRLSDMLETWKRIRRSLIESNFNNKSLVAQINAIIHTLETSKSPDTTILDAKKLLNFVDKIEYAK